MTIEVTQVCNGCGYRQVLDQTPDGWKLPHRDLKVEVTDSSGKGATFEHRAGGPAPDSWSVMDTPQGQIHLCNECTSIVSNGELGSMKSKPAPKPTMTAEQALESVRKRVNEAMPGPTKARNVLR